MQQAVFLFAVICLGLPNFAGGTPTTNRVLRVDQSSMNVAGGKATLKIGALRRTNEVFGGPFEMKVTPYFFKNDKGMLAIVIPDDTIAKASQGQKVDIKGTATSADPKGGVVVRHIEAVATPVDPEHGRLKLWFQLEDRKMVFETKYRFVAEQQP
jgi:hypothetical protein